MWLGGSSGGEFAPAEHEMLWRFPRSAWAAGNTNAAGLRTAVSAVSGCRLAVAGDCYATAAELRGGLDAVACGDWRALTCWPGSYWVVCDDGRQTTVLTDMAGTKPVYFTQHQGAIAWATQAAPLADLTGSGPDYQALTAWMTCPAVPEAYPSGTTFARVRRLPGGHALHLSGNGQARVSPYEPEDARQSFEDAAEALREALVKAVSVRAAHARRLSSDFSGGLDSTTLALIATRAGYPVFAVTHGDPAVVNDDVEYAKRLAAGEGLLTHVVAASGSLFFDNLNAAPATDLPLADTVRWAVRAGFRQPVRYYRPDVHLSGSGGDTILSAGPHALACLASATPAKMAEFVRLASARARLRRTPVHALIRSSLALSRMTYEQALDRLAAEIRHPATRLPGHTAMSWCGHGRMAAWLTTDAREQLAVKITSVGVPHAGSALPGQRTAWNELREYGAYQAELDAQTRAGGVPAHTPMLDNAVVRAAMSVGIQQRLSDTVQKPLLNAAFSGILPSLLLRRPTKGGYDSSGYAGIQANAARLTPMIMRSRLADAGIIEPQPVRDEIVRLAAGAPGRMASLEAFIAAELWLGWHAQRPRVRWQEGTPAHA